MQFISKNSLLNFSFNFRFLIELIFAGNILGSKELGEKYVKSSGDYFFSRGHTTAKADFVLASLQRSTFHIANAAPQWQTFNGGNWNTIEGNLRAYVAKLGRDIKVYDSFYKFTSFFVN